MAADDVPVFAFLLAEDDCELLKEDVDMFKLLLLKLFNWLFVTVNCFSNLTITGSGLIPTEAKMKEITVNTATTCQLT